MALVFFNPSLRTRASMQVGIYELGGNAVVLEPGGTSWTLEHREGAVMDGDKTEHVAEFVRVLERYCVAIGVRTFAAFKDWQEERTDPSLSSFAKIRVSADHQSRVGDASSLPVAGRHDDDSRETRRRTKARGAHVGVAPEAAADGGAEQFCTGAAQMGHDLVIAHPPGYDLDEELIGNSRRLATEAGGSLEITNDIDAAFAGAEVIYAKSWGAKQFYGTRIRTPSRGRNIVTSGLSTNERWRKPTTRSSCTVCRSVAT